MCTRYPIINRVSELKVHIELTRFVQPEKIEIDANERAVNEKSQYCFFVCTTFDSFLNDLYLFLKQLRMWTKAIKHQNKNISTNLINKQPVRFNVTLTRTFVVSCKVMIPVFCIQRTAIRQNIDYLKQLIKIFILLFGKLQILFKLIGKLNVVFHTSRAALSASILE